MTRNKKKPKPPAQIIVSIGKGFRVDGVAQDFVFATLGARVLAFAPVIHDEAAPSTVGHIIACDLLRSFQPEAQAELIGRMSGLHEGVLPW